MVLVEEAAEVFEAHVLACLSRSVEHLVLVGDHEQLRPKANVYELQAVSRRWARDCRRSMCGLLHILKGRRHLFGCH